jgi:two-component system, chemotaxis family, chemotaxis protein CheY
MQRILVIDDEEAIRELLRVILEKAGYSVLEAPNGLVGLQIYRAHPVDLVITDMRMPEKGGLETIQELRHDFPEARIIAISGQGDRQSQLFGCAQRLGALHAVPKPFDMAQILTVVQDALQH